MSFGVHELPGCVDCWLSNIAGEAEWESWRTRTGRVKKMRMGRAKRMRICLEVGTSLE